jgi:hypothetical protein
MQNPANNIFQIKTTLVGLIFLLIAIDYEFTNFAIETEEKNGFYFMASIIIGLGFLFAPDDLIGGIKSLIKKKTE